MPLLIVGITIGVVQAVGGYYVQKDADMYVHIYTHSSYSHYFAQNKTILDIDAIKAVL